MWGKCLERLKYQLRSLYVLFIKQVHWTKRSFKWLKKKLFFMKAFGYLVTKWGLMKLSRSKVSGKFEKKRQLVQKQHHLVPHHSVQVSKFNFKRPNRKQLAFSLRIGELIFPWSKKSKNRQRVQARTIWCILMVRCLQLVPGIFEFPRNFT